MHLNAKNNAFYIYIYTLPFLENKTVTFKPHDRRTSYPEYIKKKKKKEYVVKQFIVKTVCEFHCKLGFCKKQYCF